MIKNYILIAVTAVVAAGLQAAEYAGSEEAEKKEAFGAAAFELSDKDGNGSISLAELSVLSESRVNDRAVSADRDEDGVITLKEYVKAREGIGIKAVRSEKEFKAVDADGDGKVSPDQWKAYWTAISSKRMMERLDKDGNGSLSAGEFSFSALKPAE